MRWIRQPDRMIALAMAVAFLAATIAFNMHVKEYDVTEYQWYAHQALRHPFVAWPKEYPVLSLGFFMVPLLFPLKYRLGFALWTAMAFLVLTFSSSGLPGDRHWGKRLAIYMFLGSIGLFTQRYDIFAAVFAFWGIERARHDQWNQAWFWTMLGFWTKLFPIVFWPIFVLAEWRKTGHFPWARGVVFGVLAPAPMVVQWALEHGHGFNSFMYLLGRPIEVGSFAAGLSVLFAHHYHLFGAYGSMNVRTGIGHLMGHVLTGLAILVIGWTFYAQWKGVLSLEQASFLVLIAIILSSKVFSAQYVIWFIPLAAYWKMNLKLAIALMITTIGYPFAFEHSVNFALWVFLVRNIFLLWATVSYVRSWRASRSSVQAPDPTLSV